MSSPIPSAAPSAGPTVREGTPGPNDSPARPWVVCVLLALVAIAFWLRWRGLGALGLVVDEGFQAVAVSEIMASGIPKVDSGEVYIRAAGYLYLQAAIASVIGLDEFALRLPSVVFGALMVIPGYFLGKTLVNRNVGLFTAAFLALSLWEIELSRYARFYTALQCAWVVGLITFYHGFMRDVRWCRPLFIFVAFLSLTTHLLGLFLGTLFVIPLLIESLSRKEKLRRSLWALPFVASYVLYSAIEGYIASFSAPTSSESVPTGGEGLLESVWGILMDLPGPSGIDLDLFRLALSEHLILLLLLLPVVLLSLTLIIRALTTSWTAVFGVAAVVVAAVHQLGLALCLLGLWMLVARRPVDGRLRAAFLWASMAALACMAAWVGVYLMEYGFRPRALVMVLFGFPDLGGYLLYWYVTGWPLLTLATLIGVGMLLIRWTGDHTDRKAIFLLGSIVFPALAASLFERQLASRYMFHLYPSIVVVYSMVVWSAASWVASRLAAHGSMVRTTAVVGVLVVGFLISQDIGLGETWAIPNRGYTTPRDSERSVISWPEYSAVYQDHVGVASYVRNRAAPGDRVMVAGPGYAVPIYSHYLDHVDYMFVPGEIPGYQSVRRNGRTIHRVTGSQVIAGIEELNRLIEEEGSIWLITDLVVLRNSTVLFSSEEKARLRELVDHPDYVGRDGVSVVRRIP